jgi:hypothetical protein
MDVKPQTFTHEEVYIIRYLRRFLYERQRASQGSSGRQFWQPCVWHQTHVLCAAACSGCPSKGCICPPLSSPPGSSCAGTQRKSTLLWQKILEEHLPDLYEARGCGPLFFTQTQLSFHSRTLTPASFAPFLSLPEVDSHPLPSCALFTHT